MLTQCAKDIMTRDVLTIKRGASIDEALRLMSESHVSGLPVVDLDGCVEGIITESDVLLKGQAQIPSPLPVTSVEGFDTEDVVDEMYRRARAETVADAMTTKVVTFTEGSAVTDIARVMIEKQINRVPILRDCKVVGIVSRKDIVRAMALAVTGPRPPRKKRERIDLT
jgi:CBS domain-containing protein